MIITAISVIVIFNALKGFSGFFVYKNKGIFPVYS